MTARAVLARTLAEATDDEIRAARRLVHRVAEARRLNAAPERHYPPITSPDYPRLLAALCVELDAELDRRGSRLPGCVACRLTVDRVLPTGDAPDPSLPFGGVGVGGSL